MGLINMAKDKINKFIKEIIEMQERRQNSKTNMHLNNVRVVFSGQQYYANVQITTEAIIIKPHDEEIPVTYFLPVHLRGYSEVENRGLRINQRFNRPPYNLYFRTPAQCARALRRIRQENYTRAPARGAESTSESSEN
ncbi:hypothetical protein MTP99_015548 [Tenebrio molitor]|nr:hypothetical protein MTP99_015548 [Tenebrio molitor]